MAAHDVKWHQLVPNSLGTTLAPGDKPCYRAHFANRRASSWRSSRLKRKKMLDSHFDHQAEEQRIYEEWEKAGAFKPKDDPQAETFSIVIPPPNVTGVLHMGHALNNSLQDALCRFERMRGKRVLWQPGTDHAGIATQMVVERQLAAEGKNESRVGMGREKFVERVWEWKEESGGAIFNQLKRLGASCDWSREKFTLGKNGAPDDQMVQAVMKVFVDLYNEGLIYRDKRLVNWDPKFQTAISDLEVENTEVKGGFWHFAYPLADGVTFDFPVPVLDEDGKPTEEMTTENRDYIVVATTRPETMLGDTAVAVNKDDERYASLIGKFIDHPITGRRIPIVADEHADPEQGSGAVKITPAHDFNDYEVGKRAKLPMLNVLDNEARILETFDAYNGDGAIFTVEAETAPAGYGGLDRFAARDKIVADMDALGLLKEVEKKKIVQPFGDRSGVVIEPMLTDQWYVDAKTLAKPAIEAVEQGKTRFVPENWSKTYYNWMRDIEPWCISRQLWWGHRIPVWFGEKLANDGKIDPTGKYVEFVATTESEALEKAKAYYGKNVSVRIRDHVSHELDGEALEAVDIRQDTDVLDTWFSSALWPFSTFGWPEETDTLKAFYPTSVLVTGFDIIFFWVARMMMQGLHFMKDEDGNPQVPFKDVYIHALVCDEKGQKMSKSKGNVIDPLELVDEFGADAVRLTLTAMAAQGRDIKLSKQRVAGYRNFGTKLWNAARFCQMNECALFEGDDYDPLKLEFTLNKWIVGEVAKTAETVEREMEAYRFDQAAGAIYKFVWNVFCDWYLELMKPVLNGDDEEAKSETRKTAAWTLTQIIHILHPFMPFVTEALWKDMAEYGSWKEAGLLCERSWPRFGPDAQSADANEEIDWVIRLVTSIRSTRADLNVPAGAKAPAIIVNASPQNKDRTRRYSDIIERLARLELFSISSEIPDGAVRMVHDEATVALSIAEFIDLNAERARLSKEIDKLNKDIDGIDRKLANEQFLAKAPPEVVDEQRERRAESENVIARLQDALSTLSEIG